MVTVVRRDPDVLRVSAVVRASSVRGPVVGNVCASVHAAVLRVRAVPSCVSVPVRETRYMVTGTLVRCGAVRCGAVRCGGVGWGVTVPCIVYRRLTCRVATRVTLLRTALAGRPGQPRACVSGDDPPV